MFKKKKKQTSNFEQIRVSSKAGERRCADWVSAASFYYTDTEKYFWLTGNILKTYLMCLLQVLTDTNGFIFLLSLIFKLALSKRTFYWFVCFLHLIYLYSSCWYFFLLFPFLLFPLSWCIWLFKVVNELNVVNF